MEQNYQTNRVVTPPSPTTPNGSNQSQVFIQMQEKKSNGMGTAGFVLSLIALLLCWIPVLDWILWFLGVIFSFVGVFKSPRGLAIAGLVISFIGIIFIIAVVGAVAGALASI